MFGGLIAEIENCRIALHQFDDRLCFDQPARVVHFFHHSLQLPEFGSVTARNMNCSETAAPAIAGHFPSRHEPESGVCMRKQISNCFGWMAAHVLCGTALAQLCVLDKKQEVIPPGWSPQHEYGAAIATVNDTAFIGAPGDTSEGGPGGAVHVFQFDGSQWIATANLRAASSTPGVQKFGRAIATAGDVMIAGAPSATGRAFIFRRRGEQWVQEQELAAFGAAGSHQDFGDAVAVAGDLAVVGGQSQSAQLMARAAYVFRFDGRQWIPQQQLQADVPSATDDFGTSLAIGNGSILVGAARDLTLARHAGALYDFRREGETWVRHAKLHAFDGEQSDHFGTSMALHGSRLVVGAPAATGQTPDEGAAYVFNWNGAEWALEMKLIASGCATGDLLGASVAIASDIILLGMPASDYNSPDCGGVCVFQLRNGSWTQREALHQLHLAAWNPPYAYSYRGLGAAVAATPFGPLTSATWRDPSPLLYCNFVLGLSSSSYVQGGGAVLHFLPPEDCDYNGTPDFCDPDCNGNRQPDACDITSGLSADCNRNSIPDECEAGRSYPIDNGINAVEGSWYIYPARDFIGINRYTVKAGAQTITHIVVSWDGHTAPGLPVAVMLYADPNDDGDPGDAILLASVQTQTMNWAWDDWSYRYAIIPIPPTYVGEPGECFFVAYKQPGGHACFAWISTGQSDMPVTFGRSWWCLTKPGIADIVNLSANPEPPQVWENNSFVIHAIAADCNGNLIWDGCDSPGGAPQDRNGNGVPDACEGPTCFADIGSSGDDGIVNAADLLAVLLHWGQTCVPCLAHCAGDTNDDCLVDADDLLAVINQWGPCP